jgi:hypothetical protein
MKLVQKQFPGSRREFEIVGDAVNVRIKSVFREEKLTVMLAVLNPEPALNQSCLEFRSRVKSDPLLSLIVDKPSAREFEAFVDELKRRAREEYRAFVGLRRDSLPEGMAANVFEEPPEFGEPGRARRKKKARPIRAEDIGVSIRMLEEYLESEQIEALLDALEALQAEPESESNLTRLVKAFDELGPRQGAVLTYAPYIGILLSDDPFAD